MIKELIKLTRFEHAIMLAFAVLIAETVVLGSFPQITLIIILSLLVPMFSEMGSFALNDYLDIETDRLNKKTDRPLVRGTISPRFAFYFAICSIIISIALSYFINVFAFAIAIIFNMLAIAYNWKLKDLPLMGNVYIATTMAIPFIFGNFVVSQLLSPLALILALLGFLAGLAREIIKSVQDMEGDIKARKSKTLPVLIGKCASVKIAIVFYLLFIPLTALPFVSGLRYDVLPAIFVTAADLIIILICYNLISKEDFVFARNTSLVAFVLGMIGLFVAALL
ncbi:MAG: UbiA family prenyltransferase [Candidatus Micrarchaeota archaeon]